MHWIDASNSITDYKYEFIDHWILYKKKFILKP